MSVCHVLRARSATSISNTHHRDRKVKCDKSSPCSNCVKAGVTCVPIFRKRLPRGRHANPQPHAILNDSDELRDRIRKLETLVSNMSEPPVSGALSTSLMSLKPGPTTPSSPETADRGSEKQIEQRFWARIAEEVGSTSQNEPA